ncbi:MAG: DUF4838 domain-containing protein [Candidatus Sumerlaeia bacterium]
MNRIARCAYVLCGLLALATAAAASGDLGSVPIVVNLGSFHNAQEAIDARKSVNWAVQEGADTIICTEALAAKELHDYLCKMVGVHPLNFEVFPIVDDDDAPTTAILVGNIKSNKQVAARAAELGLTPESMPTASQSYRIVSAPKANPPVVILAGGDRIGTLYAAYEFLERQGIRWYGPGVVNENVPRIDRFKLAELDVTDAPKFLTRGFWAWEDRGTTECLEWMGRNRINLWTVEQSDPEAYKMRGIRLNCGSHFNQSFFVPINGEYPYYVPEYPATKGRPADPYKRGDYPKTKKQKGIPTYKQIHPEWYTWRDGKRVFYQDYDQGFNICESNMDAMNELMKNTITALQTRWKNADSINWWVYDGWDPWCHCDQCEALGKHTDRNLRWIYLFSKELKKAQADGRIQRNITIEFLCYNDMVEPPTRPIPADFDYENCLPTFFPIERCYVHPFNDGACSEFNRKRYYNNLITWSDLWQGKFIIGEYYNVSRYKNMPLVLDHSMRVDIPFYYSIKARYMHYMHPCTRNWGTRSLTNYHFSKQLWNPEMDVDAMLNDYFAGRYGKAAGPMREFYDTLRDAMSNQSAIRYSFRDRLTSGTAELFTEKHMQLKTTHYDPSTTDGLVYDDGPDWEEIMGDMVKCRAQLDRVKKMSLPDNIRARIAEDEGLFIYADTTYKLFDRVIACQMAITDKRMDDARKAYREAVYYGELLRADITSTKFGSAHSTSPNGYTASGMDPILKRMKKQLDL